ncbi:MAG: GGDEF domain-containing protein [Spirochaetaceae bacterium]|nr:MAG: GGDEF domain-containing protein [Spirochaetaceae bacterium]
MKGNETLFHFLKGISIFSDCTQEEIREITLWLVPEKWKKDTVLFSQGDKGEELYIVQEGQVESSIMTTSGDNKLIAKFGPGDFFGEMSIMDNAPRSATCRVEKNTMLLCMGKKDFFRMMKSSPAVGIKVMYKMLNITTRRLKTTSGFISDMVKWGNDASRRAITDEVTGAYNRRYLDRALADCFISSQAAGKPFSLVMVDLDHFREINEAYNHEVGNKLLCHVVEAFKKHLRQGDILARYGGDEFTMLFPGTQLSEAHQVAEAIRAEIESRAMKVDKFLPALSVTTSQGIAAFPENSLELEVLKNLADKALYRAKEEGRNRVALCPLRQRI